MDLGVSQAGFSVLASIEIDPFCCETLRARVEREQTETQIIQEDIRNVDPVVLMNNLSLRSGDLALLFGGPPCQAFSQIGKRGSLLDERGLLLFEIIRFADALRPRAILVEQVKGLLNAPDAKGHGGGVFSRFLAELEDLGYSPKWRVINAAEYGLPQLRQRVFIIATPKTNGFVFPPTTHGDQSKRSGLFPLLPYMTVGKALRGLPRPARGYKGAMPEHSHVDITPAGDRARICGVPEGCHLAAQNHLPQEQRQNLTKKDTTKFRRLSRNKPSLTLRCGEIFFHPTSVRYLTPREYMRLHGYPDDYLLRGPIRGRSGQVRYLDQHRQVANSVPPPVARKLAEAIREMLLRLQLTSEAPTKERKFA